MTRIYVTFDDTDTLDCGRGTGKLARWFEDELPEGCVLWGVVRQQLLVHPDVPYTSHNSSACVVLDAPGADVVPTIIERAIAHLQRHAVDGSDPGLCVATDESPRLDVLLAFAERATREVLTQADAIEAASGAGVHLSAHGGTSDGIIGAAAGTGLTIDGWSGRFIEYGGARRLRDFPDIVRVGDLMSEGMVVLPVDRNVESAKPDDLVDSLGWLRPRLWGGRPAVPVLRTDPGRWQAIGRSSGKAKAVGE
ncbi:MAG: hypothetical protein D9V44_10765 [Actinobacteria bacterium]|nr:MAG: hypothetical protein D9V44_10765 [Actinomycetota bacterium]